MLEIPKFDPFKDKKIKFSYISAAFFPVTQQDYKKNDNDRERASITISKSLIECFYMLVKSLMSTVI